MGRFMSPDPSGLSYADPGNPQSLNLYAYVLNNPLTYIDPTGLTCQTNSSDGTVYDDNDGKGCRTVDEADAKLAKDKNINAVWADGSRNLTAEIDSQQINQYVVGWLQSQAAQFPLQISQQGQQMLQQLAKDTAGVPTVCSVGVYGQVGAGDLAVGGSYDSTNGGRRFFRHQPATVGPVSINVTANSGGDIVVE
jgi:uncharacterized protein RhaS with RHS repeats